MTRGLVRRTLLRDARYVLAIARAGKRGEVSRAATRCVSNHHHMMTPA